jgi:steroid delta-isomerase-like uncharacterized protein
VANENCQVMQRWFDEVWSSGREETIDELLTADAPIQGLGAAAETVVGTAGFREFYKQLRGAFRDINIVVNEAIGEGDLVAFRWIAAATHTGDELGIPATNKKVTFSGMTFARIRGGKVIEAWNNWDMMGLMHQLGQASQEAVVSKS